MHTHLGSWIKTRRKVLDLTQEELAHKIGYAISTIRKIEAGHLRPSREMAERLAVCLEIDAAEVQTFITIARAESATTHSQSLAPTGYAPPPPVTTALIGREYELNYIQRLVNTQQSRLITLVGPPGIGKTRLAIEAAKRLSPAFAAGVCFVALESVGSPDMVIGAIAQALDIAEHPSLNEVKTILRAHQLLLILDTVEHVVAARHDIAALLDHCPQLHILATSRSALRIESEYPLLVPPLNKPPQTPVAAWETLEIYDSVQLFIAYAQLVQPAFALTAENAASIATLCAQFDGLPLALELLAARVKLLSPQRILKRITPLLETPYHRQTDRPARQQTLRTAIEWSYRLLNQPEQRLLQRLSIFSGGATRSLMQRIYAQLGDQPDAVEQLLDSLQNHSLIHGQEQWNGEQRYTLLAMIQTYAHEQLLLSGEHAALQTAYANVYIELAQHTAQAFRSPQEQHWLDLLTQEEHNLRTLLQQCLDHGQSATVLRIAGLLGRFWMFRGHISEGYQWLINALAAPNPVDAAVRARALYTAGTLAALQASYSQAASLYDECLQLYRSLDDHKGAGIALLNRSSIARQQGDYSSAEQFLSDAMTLCFDTHDLEGIAMAFTEMGLVAHCLEAYTVSAMCFTEALELLQQQENTFSWANVLSLYGHLHYDQAQYAAAKECFYSALATQRQLHDIQSIHRTLDGLALIMLEEGHIDAARRYWQESLSYAMALNQVPRQIKVLEGFALLASTLGKWHEAVQLWGKTEALRALIKYPTTPCLRQRYRQVQQQGQPMLPSAEWAALWAQGSQLSIDQAVAMCHSI